MRFDFTIGTLYTVDHLARINRRDTSIGDDIDTVVQELLFRELGDSFRVLSRLSRMTDGNGSGVTYRV